MALKTFQIDYNGEKAVIEYEDDLKFGELESIVSRAVDLSDPSKPKVNIPQYRIDIVQKVLRKAPFKTGDLVAIRNQPNSVITQIISGVMKDFPLGKYLGDWVETFAGSLPENEEDMKSISTSHQSSAGIKRK